MKAWYHHTAASVPRALAPYCPERWRPTWPWQSGLASSLLLSVSRSERSRSWYRSARQYNASPVPTRVRSTQQRVVPHRAQREINCHFRVLVLVVCDQLVQSDLDHSLSLFQYHAGPPLYHALPKKVVDQNTEPPNPEPARLPHNNQRYKTNVGGGEGCDLGKERDTDVVGMGGITPGSSVAYVITGHAVGGV
eukprot:3214282-Rhodomonas_salina.1